MLEFVLMTASLMALGAMSTDMMMPALQTMGTELGAKDANDAQLIISFIFIGLAIGQIFYGPLSDSIGRKKSIYIAFCIFIGGSLISLMAESFYAMLFGRFLQGLGVSGPKIVVLAIVRDLYEGRQMAKIMSFVATIFVLIPAFAPTVGGLLFKFWGWQSIFLMFIIAAVISVSWFGIRQGETLKKEDVKEFNAKTLKEDFLYVIKNRLALYYTIVLGIMFGVFMSYLNTAEQIFSFEYGLGEKFPLYFGINALVAGIAAIANGKIVMRLGMRYLCDISLKLFASISLLFVVVAYMYDGNPPLWLFMFFCLSLFFCLGFVFGNLNALAMEPMGHLAGMAAAVIGSVSTFVSLPIGIIIGQLYNGNLYSMSIGFAIMSILANFIFYKSQKIPQNN